MPSKALRMTKRRAYIATTDTSSTIRRQVCTRRRIMETVGPKSVMDWLKCGLRARCAKTKSVGSFIAGTESASICRGTRQRLVTFQLNLPVTPITDLRVHRGILSLPRRADLLDTGYLNVLRQYPKDAASFTIYRPDNASS